MSNEVVVSLTNGHKTVLMVVNITTVRQFFKLFVGHTR